MRWVSLVAAFALVLGLFAGCGEHGQRGGGAKTPEVTVRRPVERKVTDYSYFIGRTRAVNTVDVQPSRVTGYLVKIDFEQDQEVKKDQRLFQIDPRPYKALFDQSNSQVALMEARLKLAVADYERAKAIAKTPGAVSQQDLDKYAAAQGEADAAVKAAKASAEYAGLNLKYTDVLSPIDGKVGRNLIDEGNLVDQNTKLATVVSLDPMYAYFDVDERTFLEAQEMIRDEKMPAPKPGAKEQYPVDLGLATEQGYPHQGYLDYISNQVDPSTGTIQGRGVFKNPAPAKGGPRVMTPGLFVRIRLPLGDPRPALLVPQAAIGTDQGKKYLLVVNDQDVVEYRPVTLGPEQPEGMQVVVPVPMLKTPEGLRPALAGEKGVPSITASDRVIVSGLQRARPGIKVMAKIQASVNK